MQHINNPLRRDGLDVLLNAADKMEQYGEHRLDVRVKGAEVVVRLIHQKDGENVQLASFLFASRPSKGAAEGLLLVMHWVHTPEPVQRGIACGFPVVDAGVIDDSDDEPCEAAAAPGSKGSMLAGCGLANTEGSVA